jgi:hypothetical protein
LITILFLQAVLYLTSVHLCIPHSCITGMWHHVQSKKNP